MGRHKLPDETRQAVMNDILTGMQQTAISAKHGVSAGYVSKVKNAAARVEPSPAEQQDIAELVRHLVSLKPPESPKP